MRVEMGKSEEGAYKARANAEQLEALDLLTRAMEVEYRFILGYQKLEGLMPDTDTANMVRILGQDSLRHAETVYEAILALGGVFTIPTSSPLPDPLDLKAFFRIQLDYERLVLWLHTKATALVPPELGPHFQEIAREEEKHIGMTEEILRRLETTHG